MATFKHPIIGQEAICPDGLGRVVAYRDNFPDCWVQVETYVNNRGVDWSPESVRLVEIGPSYPAKDRSKHEDR
jgi:hypothetical protein